MVLMPTCVFMKWFSWRWKGWRGTVRAFATWLSCVIPSCHPQAPAQSRASPALAVNGEGGRRGKGKGGERKGRGGGGKKILICLWVSHFLYPVLQVYIWVKKLHNWYPWQIWGESNNAKPPARTDFPVIEDGNNKTKDRFLPSRNSLFVAAKATQNSRQTFHYFPPTVWKYGKRKSCHDFFFSSLYPKWHFFFLPSPALTNDRVGLCWSLDGGQTQQRKKLDGRQSAGNCEAAKKTEAPPQAICTTLVFLNMMRILSALLISSSLNRTVIINTGGNYMPPAYPSVVPTAGRQMKHHGICAHMKFGELWAPKHVTGF